MIFKPVALITGASRGLGKAMAIAFARQGFAIGLNYVSDDDLAKETAELVMKLDVPCKLLKADVRSPKEVASMIRLIQLDWERVDVLVNNAGIVRNVLLMNMRDDEWKDVMETNVTGAFNLIRAVAPLMKENKKGSIVNMSSQLSRRPKVGCANYNASKAALNSLTQSAALELGRYGIRVNAVFPGFHPTDMNTRVWEKYEKELRAEHLLEEMPNKDAFAEFVYNISQLFSVTGQIYPFESRL